MTLVLAQTFSAPLSSGIHGESAFVLNRKYKRKSQRKAIIRKSLMYNFALNLNTYYISQKDYVHSNNEAKLMNLANSQDTIRG